MPWQQLKAGRFRRINGRRPPTAHDKTKTAAAVGITFRALRYKLKKLGID